MNDIRRYINILESKERIDEAAPLIPLLIAGARVAAPVIARVSSRILSRSAASGVAREIPRAAAKTAVGVYAIDTVDELVRDAARVVGGTISAAAQRAISAVVGSLSSLTGLQIAGIVALLVGGAFAAYKLHEWLARRNPEAAQQAAATQPSQITATLAEHLARNGFQSSQRVAQDIVRALSASVEKKALPIAAMATGEALIQSLRNQRS